MNVPDNESDDEPKSGEVLEPRGESPDSPVGDNYIALISQYTERPDLLIKALEEHDPGFVGRMNQKAEENSDRMSKARFRFGGIQAYAGLIISVLAALTVLGLVVWVIVFGGDSGPFWTIIALVIFYAVSQGGPSGFFELVRGFADMVRSLKGPGKE